MKNPFKPLSCKGQTNGINTKIVGCVACILTNTGGGGYCSSTQLKTHIKHENYLKLPERGPSLETFLVVKQPTPFVCYYCTLQIFLTIVMLRYGSVFACIAVLTTSAGWVMRDARIPDTRPHITTSDESSSSLPAPREINAAYISKTILIRHHSQF